MTLLIDIADRIAEHTGSDRRSVMGRINRMKRELSIEAEVVALIVAVEEGMDVSDLVEHVDSELVGKVSS